MTECARQAITILGSTGSIGKSALEVVRQYPHRFEVRGLAAHSNIELLAEQVREFQPRAVAISDAQAAERFKGMGFDLPVYPGVEGMEALAAEDADTVLCAVVGAVGLKPLLAAIEAGHRVAVANKEPFVMAGKYVMERARARGATVLPVDSEHNAIFQCLEGSRKEDVLAIHLTASGGPFYRKTRSELEHVTPAEATRHPTWDMGAKISVDSATLMNKGLELVEAMWLFDMPEHQIEVVIHPQSVIHSLVEFRDGHILAHLGVTDMKFPISFALSWPERVESPMARLDLRSLSNLSFAAPDFSAFPCLGLARAAAAEGGTAPAILNAANEEAVAAFCAGQLGFLRISDVVEQTRAQVAAGADYGLDAVLAADETARAKAREIITTFGTS